MVEVMKLMVTSFTRSHDALLHSVSPTLQQATASPHLHRKLTSRSSSVSCVPEASVRNPARDKVMRKEADIRKACSDFRDPSGNS